MPKRGNQRRVRAGRKGAKVKKFKCSVMRELDSQEAADDERVSALWAHPTPAFRLPSDLWWVVVQSVGRACCSRQRVLEQTEMLARLGGACRAMRALELELGEALDAHVRTLNALRVWRRVCRQARAAEAAEQARRQKAEAMRQVTMELEREWRAELAWELRHVHEEVAGREAELARVLGATGEPPVLCRLENLALRDMTLACSSRGRRKGHGAVGGGWGGTHGLAQAFPHLAKATHACTQGWVYKEIAAYVRSMLVRAGVAPRHMLYPAWHLRVSGV